MQHSFKQNHPMFLPSNHITYASVEEMQKICQPLHKFPDVFPSYQFNYGRLYRDKRHVMLTTDPAFYKVFYGQGIVYDSPIFHSTCFLSLETGLYRTLDISPPKYADVLSNIPSHPHPERSLVLVVQANNYCEIFNFIDNTNNNYQLNISTQLPSLLKHFSLYFQERAKSLIQHATKQLISLSNNSHYAQNIPTTLTKQNQNRQIDKKSFLRELNFKRCQFEDPMLANTVFSKREFECALAIIQGKTAEETAKKLFLSRRTVETHLENLKNKLGCLNKAELKKKLLSSVALNFYQDCF